jgi:hypothetical protein
MEARNVTTEIRPEFFVKVDSEWLHIRSYAKKHNLADDCTLKKTDRYNKKMEVLNHINDNNLCLKAFFEKDIIEMKAKGQRFSELDFAA